MPLYNQAASGGISPPAGDIGGTTGTPTVVATHLSAALPVNQGGTAATSAGSWPTLNQNTSGTAAGLSATLAIGSGGTGQTSAQTAIDALAGATTSGSYLRGNGSHVVMATVGAADLPTGTTSTKGALQLDSTVTDIAAIGQQAAGSSGLAADAKHVHPFGSPAPWGSGYVAWTGDYASAAAALISPSTTAYLSGSLALTRMDCPPGASVTGTLGFVFLASASLANTYLACFNSSGAQLGSTSSDISAFTTTYHTVSLGAFTIPSDGIVYVTYLNGTGSVAGGVKYFGAQSSTTLTFNLAAPYRSSRLTGSLTAMPGSLTSAQALSGFASFYTYGWYALY